MNKSTFSARSLALNRFCLTAISITIISISLPCAYGQSAGLQPGATELDCDDEDCAAVARGRAAFSKRNLHQLGGNGRSCADCHMPTENFQLSPAAVKARFDALNAARVHNKNADDPLF